MHVLLYTSSADAWNGWCHAVSVLQHGLALRIKCMACSESALLRPVLRRNIVVEVVTSFVSFCSHLSVSQQGFSLQAFAGFLIQLTQCGYSSACLRLCLVSSKSIRFVAVPCLYTLVFIQSLSGITQAARPHSRYKSPNLNDISWLRKSKWH